MTSQKQLDTHNQFIGFGKHKGERWTRLPVSYLRWLANEVDGEAKQMAESELARRGTTTPADLELSGHAIDRASQITDEWRQQGVHSWLLTIATEALKKAAGKETAVHNGFKFVFAYGNYYPVAKTIIRANRKKSSESNLTVTDSTLPTSPR